MYLLDTNVLSEIRKKQNANKGVIQFFKSVSKNDDALYISIITIGEIRRGIEIIKHRGDNDQAIILEKWFEIILNEYQNNILNIDQDVAQLWGKLRVPHPENVLDKQIAATALIYQLTVVTRNDKDFITTGVNVMNPFT